MAPTVTSSLPTIDIEALAVDAGALLLVRRALAAIAPGERLEVQGCSADGQGQLMAWARQQGHAALAQGSAVLLTRHPLADGRWRGAQRAGKADAAPEAEAAPGWGLAARGAMVEAGSPRCDFALRQRDELWAATAGELYRQAAAQQWDPATAIDWAQPFELAPEVEAAVVQVMTYLIENENAALLVPARHLGQVHPHFREVLQLLALQCADEARHIEVFTRRVRLKGHAPALSTAGGQASLKSLFEAGDFSRATFLLSVLGEGSFVNLLNFLHAHAPDPVTRQVCRLAARDEARHVAFGMAHLEWRLAVQPAYHGKLAAAVETRHEALAGTAGLNEEVFDALVLLAAGSFEPAAVAQGHAAVQQMVREMASGRRARLLRLGFSEPDAERLAWMHTRNFM